MNSRSRVALSVTIGLLTYLSAPVLAQEDFFGAIEVDIDQDGPRSEQAVELLGWITQKVGHGLEAPGEPFSRTARGLNTFETSLYLQLDASPGENSGFRFSGGAYHDAVYRLSDHVPFSADERNEYRNRFEIRDFYYERQFDNGFYYKVGNQVLAWGMAEYLRVTDLINIEDQYTFGQQDLEDIRLQVPAFLGSYSIDDWTFDGVITWDAGRDRIAPQGDEFDQFIRLREAGLDLRRRDPARDYEVFVRASTRYTNGDIQVVAGEFNDNALGVTRIEGARSIRPMLEYSQGRMQAFGIAANWVSGSWLLFGEAGLHQNKAMRPDEDNLLGTIDGWDRKDQILGVLGAEYNGFRNLILTLEVDNIHTRAHEKGLLAGQDQVSVGVRAYWTALNERLQVLAVWNELADNTGRIGRVSADYDWSDNFRIGLLWVNYHADSDSFLYDFRNNDVLQLQLRYSFQM